MLAQNAFDSIACSGSAAFRIYDPRDFRRTLSIPVVFEDLPEHLGRRLRSVGVAVDDLRDAEPSAAGGIIGLVMGERDDQMWNSGTQHLAGCSNSSLMDDACRTRKQE
jgi:hypothetical protein